MDNLVKLITEDNHQFMDDDGKDDSDDEGWTEVDNQSGEEVTACLFCDDTFQSINEAIQHLNINHKFSFSRLKRKFKMDQYGYIKFINFVRVQKIRPEEVENAGILGLWNEEKYLKPVSIEPWLTFDFEEYEDTDGEATLDNNDNGVDSTEKCLQLKNMMERLIQEIREKDTLLEQAAGDLAKMRSAYTNLFDKYDDSKQDCPAKNSSRQNGKEIDEGYFTSYSHYSIHHEMLSDEVRTMGYRDAILNNSHLVKDKTILDVGCGTSILSMFAAQAGASKVIAIDNSSIIYNAMDIARINNFPQIEFIKGKLEDTQLPVDKFDIVVSEWMGYFLLFEGMLDSIIYARDKHLKVGGILIPNRCNMSIVGYGNETRHKDFIKFWDNVYGFNMNLLQKEVLREVSIENCSEEFVLTTSNIIADFNLMTADYNYPNFHFEFDLEVTKCGKLSAFAGYFDVFFELDNQVSFSTSPSSKPTHWKQVVFYLKDPVNVKIGDSIKGTIICKRSLKDYRALNIILKVFGNELKYSLD